MRFARFGVDRCSPADASPPASGIDWPRGGGAAACVGGDSVSRSCRERAGGGGRRKGVREATGSVAPARKAAPRAAKEGAGDARAKGLRKGAEPGGALSGVFGTRKSPSPV